MFSTIFLAKSCGCLRRKACYQSWPWNSNRDVTT